jgi:integrase
MNHDIAPASTTTLSFTPAILAGQLAPSSMAMYGRDFAAYLQFAGSPTAALDAATLARWRTALAQTTRHSPNTINRMLSAVKRLMHEGAQQGYLSHELAAAFGRVQGVKLAAMKDRTRQHARTKITPVDMRRLCSLPDRHTVRGKRDAALLATLASSGLRAAELASLTVGQILKKGNGYVLTVRGKNDTEEREAPLSKEAHALVMEWIGTRPVVSSAVFVAFAGRGGRITSEPLTSTSVWRVVCAYAEQAGLGHIKPHDFRRFVGTQLAKSDIRKAQKALGHKRIDTTARHYVLDELEPGLTDDLY